VRPDVFGHNAFVALRHGTPSIQAMYAAPSPQYVENAWGLQRVAHSGSSTLAEQHLALLFAAVHTDEENGQRDGKLSAVSAELAGYVAETASGSLRPHLAAEDSVVFLSSDTTEGKAAAFWNAGLFVRGDFTSVEWVNDGFSAPRPVKPGQVYIARVQDLTPSSVASFVQKLGSLARGLLNSIRLGAGRNMHLHLSGGLKAALPYFLAMGEWIASQGMPVTASALHEQSLTPVRLPVRKLHISDEEKAFIRGLDEDRPDLHTPEFTRLAGYAYDSGQALGGGVQAPKLTDLGCGLVRFLGPSEAAGL